MIFPENSVMPPIQNLKLSTQIPKGMRTYADFIKKEEGGISPSN